MSYSLLWIEGVAVALMWVATSAALAARIRRAARRWLFLVAALVLLLLPYGVLVAASAALKFSAGLQVSWFGYCLWLLVVSLAGLLVILWLALGRPEPGTARAAASWPVGRLAVGLVALVVLNLMTFWNLDLQVRNEAANLRLEAGAMVLSVTPPPVEDDRNAAVLYEKAFARMKGDPSLLATDSPLEADEPDLNGPAVAQLLEHHATTLRLLRDATSMPACRFEHDYAHPSITMLLPELNQCRSGGLLLSLDARYAAGTRDERRAVADMNALFRLARAAGGDPPVIVSSLVQIGLDRMGIKVMEDVLPHLRDPSQLAGLRMDDPDSIARLARRSLVGEEGFGLSLFSDLAAGRVTVQEVSGPVPPRGADTDLRDLPPLPLLMRVFVLPSDVQAYQGYMGSLQRRVREPITPTTIEQARRDSLQAAGHGVLTRMIVPALDRFLLQVALDKALHAAAWAGIAVDRYRLDHGTFPATLDALVPQYLDEVPLDPFSNQPLKYRVNAGSALIYSIGPDQHDDGGAPYDPRNARGDVVFTLKTATTTHPADPAPTTSPSGR